jgi:hypothetical protein
MITPGGQALELSMFRRMTAEERSEVRAVAEQYAEYLRLTDVTVVGI